MTLFILLKLFWSLNTVQFETIPATNSGVTFIHDNAISPNRYQPESMGPGVAIFDYDNDGWMDLYFVNSGPCDFFRPERPLRNALYHNNRDGTFTDNTEKAKVGGRDFGLGVAAADYNGAGWTDLFVTTYGACLLYRNNGHGTCRDGRTPSG